jgi:hypothetical protein
LAKLARGGKERSMEEKGDIQRLVRAANDHTFDVLWGTDAESGSFLCECKGQSCSEAVTMTLPEYTRLRDRHEFVFAGGHEGTVLD